jgi:hypothetical protein
VYSELHSHAATDASKVRPAIDTVAARQLTVQAMLKVRKPLLANKRVNKPSLTFLSNAITGLWEFFNFGQQVATKRCPSSRRSVLQTYLRPRTRLACWMHGYLCLCLRLGVRMEITTHLVSSKTCWLRCSGCTWIPCRRCHLQISFICNRCRMHPLELGNGTGPPH